MKVSTFTLEKISKTSLAYIELILLCALLSCVYLLYVLLGVISKIISFNVQCEGFDMSIGEWALLYHWECFRGTSHASSTILWLEHVDHIKGLGHSVPPIGHLQWGHRGTISCMHKD